MIIKVLVSDSKVIKVGNRLLAHFKAYSELDSISRCCQTMCVSVQLALCIMSMLVARCRPLNNGVARTPPMGWLSWERFECNTDCDVDPHNCISEHLMKSTADAMIKTGFRDAGYVYVAVDDCWLARERDSEGRLQPDPKRFPSGMKSLADYLHARGLKLGVYEDVGTKTCAGFPGTEGHLKLDAQTFASWGVDLVKYDGCNADIPQYDYGFPAFGKYLNETGRPILYSCEWPMYFKGHGGKPDHAWYERCAATCNLARQLGDIDDIWGSVLSQIGYWGDDPGNFSNVAGPGAWNDPDQLVIGDYGLSHEQERAQMAMWAVMASPLLVSADLRHIRSEARDILLNPGVIAISQDPLGVQGVRIVFDGWVTVWRRPILPTGSAAIAFLYTLDGGGPIKVSYNLTRLGLHRPNGYKLTEVFTTQQLGSYLPNNTFSCFVNPMGVYLIKAVPK